MMIYNPFSHLIPIINIQRNLVICELFFTNFHIALIPIAINILIFYFNTNALRYTIICKMSTNVNYFIFLYNNWKL